MALKIQPQNTDFAAIKDDIKSFLREQYGFSDVDFDGSNIAMLLNILAYCTSLLHYNLNMSVNELFLSSATIRKNVVAIAKTLGYTPRRAVAAQATLRLTLKPASYLEKHPTIPTPPVGYYVRIPAGTVFAAGGFQFRTVDVQYLNVDTDGSIVNTDPIPVYQLRKDESLEIHKNFDFSTDISIRIQSLEIEENRGLVVEVDGTTWQPDSAYRATEIGPTSQVYFVEEWEKGIEISFGDNNIGARPAQGAPIDIALRLTDGTKGNNLSAFTLTGAEDDIDDSIGGVTFSASDFIVALVEKSEGGQDIETSNSVKVNAPRSFVAQNRAVTISDYVTLLWQGGMSGAFGFAPASITVWGGDESVPRVLGKVFMSFTKDPIGNLLSDTEKSAVTSFIRGYSVITIQHEVVDPEFIYISIASTVKVYADAGAEVASSAQTAINAYLDSISGFDSRFRASRITTLIDEIDGVSSNEYNISLYYRLRGDGSRLYYRRLVNGIKPGSIAAAFTKNARTYFLTDSNGTLFWNSTPVGSIDYSTGAFHLNFSDDGVWDGVLGVGEYIDIAFETQELDWEVARNLILVPDVITTNIVRLTINKPE
jgi:hypothetical protein